MNSRKFNSNYRYNSKYNEEKIKKIVSRMMDESVNPQTRDFLFRYNSRNYPQTTHDELKLPGNFDEVKDTVVFVIDETAKQMDYLETIKPNGDMVKREAANNVEQHRGLLKNPKVGYI